MYKKRGGARRTPVPEIDDEHLLDTCLSHVRKLGETGAFALGKYLKTEVTHAVRGCPGRSSVPLGRVSQGEPHPEVLLHPGAEPQFGIQINTPP